MLGLKVKAVDKRSIISALQYGIWHMCRSGPAGFLYVPYPRPGSRNVQVSVFGMHDMTTHHRGDTV